MEKGLRSLTSWYQEVTQKRGSRCYLVQGSLLQLVTISILKEKRAETERCGDKLPQTFSYSEGSLRHMKTYSLYKEDLFEELWFSRQTFKHNWRFASCRCRFSFTNHLKLADQSGGASVVPAAYDDVINKGNVAERRPCKWRSSSTRSSVQWDVNEPLRKTFFNIYLFFTVTCIFISAPVSMETKSTKTLLWHWDHMTNCSLIG